MNALEKQYELTPLSAFGKPYAPPKGVVDPTIDTKTPPIEQMSRRTAATFFQTLPLDGTWKPAPLVRAR